MLGRDTRWRQGMLINPADTQNLGLSETQDSDRYTVIISHDCDLANDNEAFVEVILAQCIQKPEPMFTGARNPRKLHLQYQGQNQQTLCLALEHAQRRQIDKTRFSSLPAPATDCLLCDDEKRCLKQWLAARYGRPAFPNAFEQHLRKEYKKKSAEKHIAQILSPFSKHIIGLFLNFEEGRGVELPEGEPYVLSILVVYDALQGGIAARQDAENCATNLLTIFHQIYGAPEHAEQIALERCTAVADTMISLADVRKLDHWRLEYVSLNQNPPDDFLATGKTVI